MKSSLVIQKINSIKPGIIMNTISSVIKKALLLSVWVLIGWSAQAQTALPTYQLLVTNEVLTDSKNYQFDVFLLSTGNDSLELATVQFGLGFDNAITNGGTLTASIVGNSELLPAQVAISVMFGSTVTDIGGINYRFFNCAARAPQGWGFGTMISKVNGGCNHPGTRVGTFKLTNSVPFAASTHCNHVFSTSAGSGRTNTLVNAYVGIVNTAITNTANHLGFNAVTTCDQNILMNGCIPPTVSATHLNATCSSATGSIDITASGSAGAYSYLWHDGSTNEDRTKLKSGTYTVTVTNSSGCTASMVVTIQGVAVESKIIVENKISCYGSCNGTLKVQKVNGVGPFTYLWNNGATTQRIVNLCSGTYTVTVTDAKGCTGVANKVLTQPSVIVASCTKTEISAPGANDGAITWSTKGGSAPYSYLWNDGYTSGNRTNIAPGTYTIIITDANGCSVTVTKRWKNGIVRLSGSSPDASVSVFPNPSSGLFTIQIGADAASHYVINVTDMASKVVISKDYELEAGDQQIVMDLSAMPKGIYMLDIKGDEIKEIQKIIMQ